MKMNNAERYYLTESELTVMAEDVCQVETSESKGCPRRKFFKVDEEGFIYATYERPSHIIERDDYDE